jgi:hypothetical protein
MGKLGFYLSVVIVAIIGIYIFKLLSAMVPSQGLQSFAQAI